MHVQARRFVWSLAALLAMSWPLPFARGQNMLPPDVTSVTAPFTNPQRQVVDQFTSQWTAQLTADAEAAVAEARSNLVTPLRATTSTPSFKDQYSRILAPKLAQGAAGKRMIVRLNTMIVAGNLVGTSGLDILRAALGDQVGSIRYWAAKGIAQALAGQPDVPGPVAQNVVNGIDKQLAVETSASIREQHYLALASLNNAQSRAALIKAMNKRVAGYAQAGLNADLHAEQVGLSRLYTALLTAFLQNAANKTEVSELVTICARYVQLIQVQAGQGGITSELSPIVFDLVQVAETAMNWGLQEFDPSAAAGPALDSPLRAGNQQQFRLNVLDWVQLLQKSKIKIPAKDLAIPAAAAAN